MMAVLGISSSLIPSVTNLALLSVPINEAKVAFNRMFEFLSIDPENLEGEPLEEIHKIELKGVSFRYPGRKPLFEHLNLVAKRGDVILITGGNGSGKTTLLQLLQKFYVPEGGKIIVNQSQDLQVVSTSILRQHIGVIDQDVPIFNGTLADNLLIAQANRNLNELDAFLEKSGFNPFFQSFPNGYTTLLGEEGINLSGGQKQLIGLCRVLMRNPQVLILDEPETALDGDVWAFFIQQIEAIKPHALIFICTHEPVKYRNLTTVHVSI
jgi:ATP-binding cassette subfamily B protein